MRKIRIALLSALVVSALAVPLSSYVRPAFAISPICGMVLPAGAVILTPAGGFLGPCPGDGLVIIPGTTVLDLNGWHITGICSPTALSLSGILVSPGVSSVLISSSSGSAFITCFHDGISIFGASPCTASGGNEVSNALGNLVTIAGNFGTGIHIACSNNNKIANNDITSNGGLGIFIDNGFGNKILGNYIVGHTVPVLASSTLGGGAGVEIHIGPSSVIKGNTIASNTNGLYMDGFSGGSQIKGNTFASNSSPCLGTDSIPEPEVPGEPQCGYGFVTNSGSNTIKGNTAINNALDGISIAGDSNVLVGNTASFNGLRGIGLGNVCAGALPDTLGTGFPAGNSNTLAGSNTATGNGVSNFYWDGNGVGNLFSSALPIDGPTPLNGGVVMGLRSPCPP